MFVIFPLLMFSMLMSLTSLAIVCSLYGVGLILLAHGIRNVRMESSRKSVRDFLNYVAIDHYLSAAMAFGCIAILSTEGGELWLEYAMKSPETSLVPALGTILGTLMVIFLGVGVLLQRIAPDLRANVSIAQQTRWIPWTHVMTLVGLALNLMTFGCMLIVLAPLLWHLSRLDRVSRQSTLIWTLAIAMRQGLPLGNEVEILANGLWGRRRLRLQLLSENLNAGLSLSAALERQPGMVPLSTIMLIRMGEETNSLVPALENCALSFGRFHDRQVELIGAEQALTLLLIPLFVMPQIVGFLCYYIVPKFKKIFQDFGTPLPEVTINMIYVADMGVKYGVPLFGFGCMGGIAVGIYACFRDWERDWPLLPVLLPRADGPAILRGLALMMRQQRPLSAGILALSASHPRRSARRKLNAVYSQLADGRDLPDALADQRLIRRGDAVLLKTAERVQNMPWVLDQLAELIEQKFWYRLRLFLEIGYPIGLILLGMAVLFFVLAFYMPLIDLINSLTDVRD